MYAGRIVEDLPAAELADLAQHPYTRALVAAVPDMDTDLDRPLAVVPGRPVDPAEVPTGCAYAARCPLADALPRAGAVAGASRDGASGLLARGRARSCRSAHWQLVEGETDERARFDHVTVRYGVPAGPPPSSTA